MAEAQVVVSFDPGKLRDLYSLLGEIPKGLPKVLSRAVNRAALTMRSRVAHNAGKALDIPVRGVKGRIRHTNATEDNPSSVVTVSDRGFSLWWFHPVRKAAGALLTKGPLAGTVFLHAWIARLRTAQIYPGVYRRKGKERFPVQAVRSDGVVETIKDAGGWDAEYAATLDHLDKRLRAETERMLAGGKWEAVGSYISETWSEWRSRMGVEEFR